MATETRPAQSGRTAPQTGVLTPTIVAFVYFNDKGQQRGGNMMVHAPGPNEARAEAIRRLQPEHKYFRITKIEPFENDNPQQSL